MTRSRHPAMLLLLCAAAGPCFVLAGGVAAQGRTGQWLSSMRAAIEEVRRSPFHASGGPRVPLVPYDEVRQSPSQVTNRRMDSEDSAASGPNIFFLTLPVAAELDAFAMAGVQ